jgi:phosphohistidine phosphatase SixA/8-oxo-dGTP pyrophosphatase MutT (NUDIX family)
VTQRAAHSSRQDGHRARGPIKAAGGVIWREDRDGREVLLVHRPKYDDWSLPKGKLNDREPAPLGAIREIVEETGWHVRLGHELRTAHYAFDGAPKEVRYWLADPLESELFVPNDEVDEIAWVNLAETKSLVRPFDHALVHSAVPKARPAAPLVVVRHALSMRRKEWKGDDRDRPLSRDGKAQALRIGAMLEAWAPRRVVTSSSRRCRDTVSSYAESKGLELELADALTEEAFEDNPKPARALLAELRDSGEPVVVCTHRPLLATVARVIGLDLAKSARSNPLPKGGLWVAHPGAKHRVERYTV